VDDCGGLSSTLHCIVHAPMGFAGPTANAARTALPRPGEWRDSSWYAHRGAARTWRMHHSLVRRCASVISPACVLRACVCVNAPAIAAGKCTGMRYLRGTFVLRLVLFVPRSSCLLRLRLMHESCTRRTTVKSHTGAISPVAGACLPLALLKRIGYINCFRSKRM